MNVPLVSIIIPIYNGSQYVAEAIESALTQSYPNIEIILINDGSDDNGLTERAIKPYKRHVQIETKDNGGCASALNLGLRKMKGSYFSWLSHDDVYTVEKISAQIDLAMGKGNKTIVYSNYNIIDESGDILTEHSFQLDYNTLALEDPYIPLALSLINGCAMLISKDLLVGGFEEKYLTTQDYEKWRQILPTSTILFSEKCALYSRQHNNQGSYVIPTHKFEAEQFWLKLIADTHTGDYLSSLLNKDETLVLLRKHLRNSDYLESKSLIEKSLETRYLQNHGNYDRDYWLDEIQKTVLQKVRK
jgi:glycosyltransferase involved in cell wall biosynthesis